MFGVRPKIEDRTTTGVEASKTRLSSLRYPRQRDLETIVLRWPSPYHLWQLFLDYPYTSCTPDVRDTSCFGTRFVQLFWARCHQRQTLNISGGSPNLLRPLIHQRCCRWEEHNQWGFKCHGSLLPLDITQHLRNDFHITFVDHTGANKSQINRFVTTVK